MIAPATHKLARPQAGRAALSARPFETELLGIPTAYLEVDGGSDVGTSIARALAEAARNGIRLVTCRHADSDVGVLDALQAAGFRVIECLVTLECELRSSTAQMADHLRLAQRADADADADAVAAIAATAFRHDRFHADPLVPDAAADRFKEVWARNCVNGRADAVFVTEESGRINGFNACLLRGDTVAIDLIAVANGAQRRGLGRSLVDAALSYYFGKAARIIVGTQSANQPSLALYEAAGFRIKSSAFTLHAHLK